MICPDCDGWGYAKTGGVCSTCNGEGEIPDDVFPTEADVKPAEEPSEPEFETPPFKSELDEDWWKGDQESDDDHQEES